jgi:hypothetical protein
MWTPGRLRRPRQKIIKIIVNYYMFSTPEGLPETTSSQQIAGTVGSAGKAIAAPKFPCF